MCDVWDVWYGLSAGKWSVVSQNTPSKLSKKCYQNIKYQGKMK